MEKFEVSELLEHLAEQEVRFWMIWWATRRATLQQRSLPAPGRSVRQVVSETSKVEAEAAEYEAKGLFEFFETYEGFDSDEGAKGKIGLLIISILILVDSKRGASVKKSVGN